MKNGIVLSWGESLITSGRKCKNSGEDRLIPMGIELNPKIIVLDIACGQDHTLIKTNEHHLYTWGSNQEGQVIIIIFMVNEF